MERKVRNKCTAQNEWFCRFFHFTPYFETKKYIIYRYFEAFY